MFNTGHLRRRLRPSPGAWHPGDLHTDIDPTQMDSLWPWDPFLGSQSRDRDVSPSFSRQRCRACSVSVGHVWKYVFLLLCVFSDAFFWESWLWFCACEFAVLRSFVILKCLCSQMFQRVFDRDVVPCVSYQYLYLVIFKTIRDTVSDKLNKI